MAVRIFALLLCIGFIVIISLAESISDYLREKNLFGFGIARYRNESVTRVRLWGMIGLLLSGVLVTQSSQLIIGIIMITLGLITLQYSVPIYNFVASAGMSGSAWFKGDDGIKLAGVLMVIGGGLWMSGLTQTIIVMIFRSGGLAG